MKSILSLLLLATALRSSAQAESRLRGAAASEVEQARQLENNNQWKQWMQYYNSNNNYRSYNQGNGNNRGYGYYAAKRYYYNQSNKNQNEYYQSNNQYYGYQQDDAQVDDAGAEDQNENTDDASGSDDNNASTFIPSEIEEKFWQWYESPPSQWTAGQWAWFSGILVVTIGFMFCCCLGCANLCMEGQDRACNNKNTKGNFDDYTSLDSAKRGSFMTLETKDSGSATGDTVNDDASYDTIMRMRSSG